MKKLITQILTKKSARRTVDLTMLATALAVVAGPWSDL